MNENVNGDAEIGARLIEARESMPSLAIQVIDAQLDAQAACRGARSRPPRSRSSITSDADDRAARDRPSQPGSSAGDR